MMTRQPLTFIFCRSLISLSHAISTCVSYGFPGILSVGYAPRKQGLLGGVGQLTLQ